MIIQADNAKYMNVYLDDFRWASISLKDDGIYWGFNLKDGHESQKQGLSVDDFWMPFCEIKVTYEGNEYSPEARIKQHIEHYKNRNDTDNRVRGCLFFVMEYKV